MHQVTETHDRPHSRTLLALAGTGRADASVHFLPFHTKLSSRSLGLAKLSQWPTTRQKRADRHEMASRPEETQWAWGRAG